DAPRFTEVGQLLQSMGAAESSTRFRFRKKGLPAPSRWLQAARGLHAALRIQLEPEKSILAHACALGYADHSALCHQMKRMFGTTPAAVRGTLGWEWLLERWVRNEVLAPRQRSRCCGQSADSSVPRVRRIASPAAPISLFGAAAPAVLPTSRMPAASDSTP